MNETREALETAVIDETIDEAKMLKKLKRMGFFKQQTYGNGSQFKKEQRKSVIKDKRGKKKAIVKSQRRRERAKR